MERPHDLPNFESPPLVEVVLGVQFEPVPGYTQIYARDVWSLFEKRFPKVEEHQALAPTFETFGGTRKTGLNLQVQTGASHDRYWFIAEDRQDIIQFQKDRFLRNWRKTTDNDRPYPHFEEIHAGFEEDFEALCEFFTNNFGSAPAINQCEITYVNFMEFSDERPEGDDWLQFANALGFTPDDFKHTFRKSLYTENNQPIGRLFVDAASATDEQKRSGINLTITVKGAPEHTELKSASDFLKMGRREIVERFAELTTKNAHEAWGRLS